jgi:hypothetical protein
MLARRGKLIRHHVLSICRELPAGSRGYRVTWYLGGTSDPKKSFLSDEKVH